MSESKTPLYDNARERCSTSPFAEREFVIGALAKRLELETIAQAERISELEQALEITMVSIEHDSMDGKCHEGCPGCIVVDKVRAILAKKGDRMKVTMRASKRFSKGEK